MASVDPAAYAVPDWVQEGAEAAVLYNGGSVLVVTIDRLTPRQVIVKHVGVEVRFWRGTLHRVGTSSIHGTTLIPVGDPRVHRALAREVFYSIFTGVEEARRAWGRTDGHTPAVMLQHLARMEAIVTKAAAEVRAHLAAADQEVGDRG